MKGQHPPNLTKIDRFVAPVSTKMGLVGGPSLAKIGRVGTPINGQNWRKSAAPGPAVADSAAQK